MEHSISNKLCSSMKHMHVKLSSYCPFHLPCDTFLERSDCISRPCCRALKKRHVISYYADLHVFAPSDKKAANRDDGKIMTGNIMNC